jgi:hypothetical protein
MDDIKAVIEQIYEAFGHNDYPGDDYLQGSFEGCEPYEEIEPFKGRQDWKNIDLELLDTHSGALNFFSEAGLRYFLPAYLIADLHDELKSADPMFVLVHGFSDLAVNHQIKERVFVRRTGKTTFVNPKRYGALTFYDYACWRLSIFTREEAQAIVAYLRYRRDSDRYDLDKNQIETALNLYWSERAENAPTAESLKQHLIKEEEYLAAISLDVDKDS